MCSCFILLSKLEKNISLLPVWIGWKCLYSSTKSAIIQLWSDVSEGMFSTTIYKLLVVTTKSNLDVLTIPVR